MSRLYEDIDICACCGHYNFVTKVASLYIDGYKSLDFRQPDTFRSLYVKECCQCGYSNIDITELIPGSIEYMQSKSYKTLDGMRVSSSEAQRFIRYALLKANEGNIERACYGFLLAAWMCDDDLDRKGAIKLRNRVAELMLLQYRSGLLDTGSVFQMIDVLRRCKRFREAQNILSIEYDKFDAKLSRAAEFEMKAIRRCDAESYSFDDVEDPTFVPRNPREHDKFIRNIRKTLDRTMAGNSKEDICDESLRYGSLSDSPWFVWSKIIKLLSNRFEFPIVILTFLNVGILEITPTKLVLSTPAKDSFGQDFHASSFCEYTTYIKKIFMAVYHSDMDIEVQTYQNYSSETLLKSSWYAWAVILNRMEAERGSSYVLRCYADVDVMELTHSKIVLSVRSNKEKLDAEVEYLRNLLMKYYEKEEFEVTICDSNTASNGIHTC